MRSREGDMLPRYNSQFRMFRNGNVDRRNLPKKFRMLRKHTGWYRLQVRVEAAVFMSATIEYLVAEVLELAGNCSKYDQNQPLKSILLSSTMCLSRYMKKRSIIPHHIQVLNCLIHTLL